MPTPAMITVTCPKCSKRMRAASEHVGRKGRCPNCGTLLEIVAPLKDESAVVLQPATATGILRRKRGPRLSSTAGSTWLALCLGLAVTAAIYGLVFLVLGRGNYVTELLTERGPMQYCIVLVTAWGLSLLFLKWLAVHRQVSYTELDLKLIPLEIGVQITPGNVDQFLEHLGKVGEPVRNSILGRRIQGALEHFKSRTSVPEVQQYLATQAELDASGVDSGYILLRAFIWVIPLLGFIGTVTGISFAVSGFRESMAEASEPAVTSQAPATPAAKAAGFSENDSRDKRGERFMRGLERVTAGLATAFDTTFLALVMAIVLLFPTEQLRKTEYAMLDRIEAFSNESLLRRMADDEKLAPEKMPEIVRDALKSAFCEHQRWLAEWQLRVGDLGRAIGEDFQAAFERVHERLCQQEAARTENRERLARLLEDILQKANQQIDQLQQAEGKAIDKSRDLLTAVSQLEQSLGAMPEIVRTAQEASLREHQAWLAEWKLHVQEIGRTIGRDFEAAASRVSQQLSARIEHQEQLAQQLNSLLQKADEQIGRLKQSEEKAAETSHELVGALSRLEQSLSENVKLLAQLCQSNASPSAGPRSEDGGLGMTPAPEIVLVPADPPVAPPPVARRRVLFGWFRR